jgi:hypothetical protein
MPRGDRTQPLQQRGQASAPNNSGVMAAMAGNPMVQQAKGFYEQFKDPWRPSMDFGERKLGFEFERPLLGGTLGYGAGGNPDDYINVRHDMGDDVEEEGGGWLSNPLEDLRRRRREEDLRRLRRDPLNDLFFKRMMEDNLKFQMDMLMNPNKFNTSPGTGDINPILGDPYWNI